MSESKEENKPAAEDLMDKESNTWKQVLRHEPTLTKIPDCVIQHLTVIEANRIPIIAIPTVKDRAAGTWVTPVAPFSLKNPADLKRLHKIIGETQLNENSSIGQAVEALSKISPYRLPTLAEWRLLGERLDWASDSYGVTSTRNPNGNNEIVLTGYDGGGGIDCFHAVPPNLKTDDMNFHLVFDWRLLQNSLSKA